MAYTKEHTGRFLNDLSFFKGLPEEDLEVFLDSATVKNYAKDTTLFLQGDDANRFFIIYHGWIKLYRNTEEGDEAVVALFTRGDVFGEAAIFGGAEYPFSAEAVEKRI